jgi:hypothetical protein
LPEQPVSCEPDLVDAALALALPSASIVIIESFILLISSRLYPGEPVGLLSISRDYVFLAGVLAMCAYFYARSGATNLLACAAGTAIALFLMYHFRGSHIWLGTFDRFERSASVWWAWGFLAFAFGATVGLVLARVRIKTISRPFVGFVISVGVAVSWFDARSNLLPSAFAPTRHLALLLMCLPIVLALAYSKLEVSRA